jgi:hypothetical protein
VILQHLENQAEQIERQGELILEILRRLGANDGAPSGAGQPAAGASEAGG